MICNRCGVRIDGKTVIFSCGKAGTLERLYTRVCRHTQGRFDPNGNYCVNPCSTYVEKEDYGQPLTELNHQKIADEILANIKL